MFLNSLENNEQDNKQQISDSIDLEIEQTKNNLNNSITEPTTQTQIVNSIDLEIEQKRKELEKIKLEKEIEALKNNQSLSFNNTTTNHVSQKSDSIGTSSDIDKLNKIRKLFKLEIIFFIITIALIPIFLVSWLFLAILGIVFMILLVGFGITVGVINLVIGIKILTTDFDSKEINDKKLIWGLLTILLLGWISTLVFILTSKKILLE